MSKLKKLVVVSSLLLVSCVTNGKEPAEEQAKIRTFTVECLDKEKYCYQKAETLCPQGYSITDKTSRGTVDWRGFATQNTIKYKLEVECKQ